MPFIGSAPNKTYRRTDGTRTGTETWQEADAAAVPILSTSHDSHDQDMADAINTAWQRDGANQPTADLPMGGFKLTGAGSATARTHLPLASQVQDSSLTFGGTAGGTANSITISLTPAITSYPDGLGIAFRASANCTGTTAISVNSVGDRRITKIGGANLSANDFASGDILEIRFSSTANTFSLNTGQSISGKANTATTISAGTGLTGGGSLAANRSIAIDKASNSNIRSAASNKVVTADLIETASALVTLTDGATIALDWDTGINFKVTLAGNRTLSNPTNGQPGTWRKVMVYQSTGNNTLSFGTSYKFPGAAAPTLTTTAAAEDVLMIFCETTSRFIVYSTLNVG